ncbi:hypothetical protein N2152v2_002988 [Parachlorella kessleri]
MAHIMAGTAAGATQEPALSGLLEAARHASASLEPSLEPADTNPGSVTPVMGATVQGSVQPMHQAAAIKQPDCSPALHGQSSAFVAWRPALPPLAGTKRKCQELPGQDPGTPTPWGFPRQPSDTLPFRPHNGTPPHQRARLSPPNSYGSVAGILSQGQQPTGPVFGCLPLPRARSAELVQALTLYCAYYELKQQGKPCTLPREVLETLVAHLVGQY